MVPQGTVLEKVNGFEKFTNTKHTADDFVSRMGRPDTAVEFLQGVWGVWLVFFSGSLS